MQFLISFLVLIILGLILFGVILCLKRKHFVPVCVIILLIATSSLLLYHTCFFYRIEEVSVGKGDSKVALSLNCRKSYATPQFYQFITDKTMDEILIAVQEKYPQAFYDPELDAIYFIQNKQIYSVELYDKKPFLFMDRYYYMLSVDSILIERNEDSENDVNIPFPSNALKGEYVGANREYDISCEDDKIFEIFSLLPNAEITEDEIIITQDDVEYKLIIHNGKMVVQL